MIIMTNYDDSFPTCLATHAAIRIFHDDLDPNEITKLLGITPTYSHQKGEDIYEGKLTSGKRKTGGWLLDSESQVESRDSRRHIDWLLDHVENKIDIIHELQENGYVIDLLCYWLSDHGEGGPIVSVEETIRLAKLNIELGFDIYFNGEK